MVTRDVNLNDVYSEVNEVEGDDKNTVDFSIIKKMKKGAAQTVGGAAIIGAGTVYAGAILAKELYTTGGIRFTGGYVPEMIRRFTPPNIVVVKDYRNILHHTYSKLRKRYGVYVGKLNNEGKCVTDIYSVTPNNCEEKLKRIKDVEFQPSTIKELVKMYFKQEKIVVSVPKDVQGYIFKSVVVEDKRLPIKQTFVDFVNQLVQNARALRREANIITEAPYIKRDVMSAEGLGQLSVLSADKIFKEKKDSFGVKEYYLNNSYLKRFVYNVRGIILEDYFDEFIKKDIDRLFSDPVKPKEEDKRKLLLRLDKFNEAHKKRMKKLIHKYFVTKDNIQELKELTSESFVRSLLLVWKEKIICKKRRYDTSLTPHKNSISVPEDIRYDHWEKKAKNEIGNVGSYNMDSVDYRISEHLNEMQKSYALWKRSTEAIYEEKLNDSASSEENWEEEEGIILDHMYAYVMKRSCGITKSDLLKRFCKIKIKDYRDFLDEERKVNTGDVDDDRYEGGVHCYHTIKEVSKHSRTLLDACVTNMRYVSDNLR